MTKITHDKASQTRTHDKAASGIATTDEGKKVARTPGTIPNNAPAVDEKNPVAEKARILTEEELATLAGDLAPGENGYLPLDEDGRPSGPATREPPAEGDYASVTVPIPTPPKELMTPSGAPVTHMMNPDANVVEKREKAAQVDSGLSAGAEHENTKD